MRSSLAASCAALVLAAGCGEDEDAGRAPDSAKVDIAGFSFMPDPVRVRAGGTIVFTNRDRAPHNAESPGAGFDTVRQETGDTKRVTLDRAGTYEYFCRFHRFMTGTVEVLE